MKIFFIVWFLTVIFITKHYSLHEPLIFITPSSFNFFISSLLYPISCNIVIVSAQYEAGGIISSLCIHTLNLGARAGVTVPSSFRVNVFLSTLCLC